YDDDGHRDFGSFRSFDGVCFDFDDPEQSKENFGGSTGSPSFQSSDDFIGGGSGRDPDRIGRCRRGILDHSCFGDFCKASDEKSSGYFFIYYCDQIFNWLYGRYPGWTDDRLDVSAYFYIGGYRRDFDRRLSGTIRKRRFSSKGVWIFCNADGDLYGYERTVSLVDE